MKNDKKTSTTDQSLEFHVKVFPGSAKATLGMVSRVQEFLVSELRTDQNPLQQSANVAVNGIGFAYDGLNSPPGYAVSIRSTRKELVAMGVEAAFNRLKTRWHTTTGIPGPMESWVFWTLTTTGTHRL